MLSSCLCESRLLSKTHVNTFELNTFSEFSLDDLEKALNKEG